VGPLLCPRAMVYANVIARIVNAAATTVFDRLLSFSPF
jgi:hypothetical protein